MFFIVALPVFSLHADSSGTLPTAPVFSARDINNRLISSDDLRKKGPVIVDFWATWCKPCMAEFKALKKLVEKYKEQHLKVIAVNLDGAAEASKVKQMAAMKRWPFTVVVDSDRKIADKFQVRAMPESFLIGTDGKIHAAHRGYIIGDEVKLEEEIRELLGTK